VAVQDKNSKSNAGVVANPIKLFFFANEEFFCFFAAKLGHFIIKVFFSLYNITLKLNSKNRKMKKKKFYRIASF